RPRVQSSVVLLAQPSRCQIRRLTQCSLKPAVKWDVWVSNRSCCTPDPPVAPSHLPMTVTTALPDHTDAAELQRYARIAGIAMLLSIIFGALGEAYIPGRIIVRGDAAATAANIMAHPVLFRMGFATYLVEGICDIALSVIFYILLRPVNRNLALISAFFGVASMITFASAESSYYAASLVVRD